MKPFVTLLALTVWGGTSRAQVAGDFAYYRMCEPKEGAFFARRHFGYAHFAADSSWLKNRSGGGSFRITDLSRNGDSITFRLHPTSGPAQHFRGVVRGDTITGRQLSDTATLFLVSLIKRTTPPAFEPPYSPWPGAASEPRYRVRIDSAVPMKTRDGTTLMSLVARPIGDGPFPVVMERTPYLRLNYGGLAEYWASRGYILVRQDVRGRGASEGVYLHQVDQVQRWLRRRRMGRTTSRQQWQGWPDRRFESRAVRRVRGARSTAAPLGDRANGHDGRWTHPRRLHRHGVLDREQLAILVLRAGSRVT